MEFEWIMEERNENGNGKITKQAERNPNPREIQHQGFLGTGISGISPGLTPEHPPKGEGRVWRNPNQPILGISEEIPKAGWDPRWELGRICCRGWKKKKKNLGSCESFPSQESFGEGSAPNPLWAQH